MNIFKCNAVQRTSFALHNIIVGRRKERLQGSKQEICSNLQHDNKYALHTTKFMFTLSNTAINIAQR